VAGERGATEMLLAVEAVQILELSQEHDRSLSVAAAAGRRS